MPTPEQIRPVKKKAESGLLKKAGVCGVDIGQKIVGGKKTDQLAIRVYVARKKDVPAKDRIPQEIEGFATDVIEMTFKLHALMPVADLAPKVDATRYTNLRGGMSIGPCRSVFKEPPEVETPGNYVVVGTLGAMVVDNATQDRMILTNFHVAAVDNTWNPGDDMAQPGRPDGGICPADIVGELQRAVVSGSTAGGNPGVDAAVANIGGQRPSECSVIGIGDIKGTAAAASGMAVRKRGRTTELTHGTVQSTDLTVRVPYFNGIGDVTFEDQILIEVDETKSTTFGQSGDSGSVVVNDDGKVVGLYFAGSNEVRDAAGNVVSVEGVVGVANPIAAVEAALDVTVCQAKVLKEGKDALPKEFKDFGPKELKDFGPKEFKEFLPKEIKEFQPKEFKEFQPKEFKEFQPKEFKEFQPKEIKEFQPKEFKEPKEIFEVPGGPGGFSPGFQFPFGSAASRKQECIEFDKMKPQPVTNPVTFGGASFRFLDHAGNPWPNPGIKSFGMFIGLDTGFRTEIKLREPCRRIEITLVHFSQPVKVEAYDAAGTLIGAAAMSGPQGVAETLTLGGGEIQSLVVLAPQNEALILRICCVDTTPCDDDCIEFSRMRPQPVPNPASFDGATFTFLDHAGNPWPSPGIKNMSGFVGLDAGFRTEIKLGRVCESVEITLVHFSSPATVEAYNPSAILVDSASMSGPQGTPETLVLTGGIASLVVIAPQDETLILRLCCCSGGKKPEKPEKPEKCEKPEKNEKLEKPEKSEKPEKLEKPEKNEKLEKHEKREKPEKLEKPEKNEKHEPKEIKEPKELKEQGPKELKELTPKEGKEKKELKEPGPKEGKEPKELKEQEPKEFKELKEFDPKESAPKELKEPGPKEGKEPKENFEKPTDAGPPITGPIEDRLARIETAMGQLTHFITQALRPDLATGALKQEPDYSGTRRQDLQKQASDSKQAKDAKDTKESDV